MTTTVIHTRYLPGKIKAYCAKHPRGFSKTIPYPHELPQDEKHVAAAKLLAARLEWRGLWIVGQNADGSVSCTRVPGSYSREWVNRFIPGKENADFFYIEEENEK